MPHVYTVDVKHKVFVMFFLFLSIGGTGLADRAVTGCGVILDIQEGKFVVAGYYKKSPAQRALRKGDVIARVEKWRASLQPGEQVAYSKLLSALEPGTPGQEVKVTVLRGGQPHEVTMTSKRWLLDSSTAPESSFEKGRLVVSAEGKFATFPNPNDFRVGDQFYAYRGKESVGTVSLNSRLGDKFEVIAHVPNGHGASLLFYKHDFSIVDRRGGGPGRGADKGTLAKIPGQAPSLSEAEVDRVFREYKSRKDLQRGVGEVLTHQRAGKAFLVKMPMDAGSVTPNSSVIRYTNQMVYYTSSTRFVPVSSADQVRPGRQIGFFYKKRGNRMVAELVHVLK